MNNWRYSLSPVADWCINQRGLGPSFPRYFQYILIFIPTGCVYDEGNACQA
jgi:hypothetical protein